MNRPIQLIPSTQIDFTKWDHCIAANENGLIYSSSEYLNNICSNWHGMVIDDYRAVMPIPWRKKYGIRYAYIPAFMQQTGLTGMYSETELTKVIKMLQQFVTLADYHFNFSNKPEEKIKTVSAKTNFIIHLDQGIETIYSRYSSDLKENIRKATASQLQISNGDVGPAIHYFKEYYANRFPHTKEVDYSNFRKLCLHWQKKDQCFVKVVESKEANLLAIALFLKDEKRVYNLMNTTLPEGRNREANHFLLHSVITEFAGQSLLFDFEGSDLPGVKQFYEKFGAKNQPYYHYHFNGLPWPIHLLKR